MRLDRLRKKREIISHLNIRQRGWYSKPKINPGPCICVNLFLWVNQWIASVPPQYSSILGYFNIIYSRLGAEGCVTSLLCDRQNLPLASIHFLSSLSDVCWLLLMFAELLLFARSDRLPHGILGTAAISSAYCEGGIHLSLISV